MYSYFYDRPDLDRESEETGLTTYPAAGEGVVRRRPVPPPDRVYTVRRRLPPPRPVRRTGAGRRIRAGISLGLFVLLILGGIGGAVVLRYWDVPGSVSRWERPEDRPERDWEKEERPAASRPPKTTVERAPLGDGTVLLLTGRPEGEGLTPQKIYADVLPSIVSVEAMGDDGISQGTGVVFTRSGYILTNHHVIEGARWVSVEELDGSGWYNAKLVGSDQPTDLAVLKVETKGRELTPAVFGDSEELQIGDSVFAIGNALGEELPGTMTDGIISYLNRPVEIDGYQMELIQTSAAINPGNSGGALVNQYGQVVGVTSLKMWSIWEPIEGLGFAIPTSTVKDVVDELIAAGRVTGRAMLGITAGPSEYYSDDPDAPAGLCVVTVDERSDAYKKGLRAGDIIVSVNGRPTPEISALEAEKEGLEPGDTLSLRVWQSGTYVTLEVELIEQYELTE